MTRRIAAAGTLAADSQHIVSAATALAEALDAEVVLVGIASSESPLSPAARVEDGNWLAADSEQRLLDLLVRERLDELSGGPPA